MQCGAAIAGLTDRRSYADEATYDAMTEAARRAAMNQFASKYKVERDCANGTVNLVVGRTVRVAKA